MEGTTKSKFIVRCAVIDCPYHFEPKEESKVFLGNKERLLFSTYFCIAHMKAFQRHSVYLTQLLFEGKIIAVAPIMRKR